MKIAFESQLFLKGKKTGIAWCADNIIKEISKMEENECVVNYFSLKYSETNLKEVERYQKYKVKLNPCKWFNDILYKLIWAFIPIPYSLFFNNKSDIVQFFNYAVPPGVKGKKVTMIPDMVFYAYPETMKYKSRVWLKLVLKKSCSRSDAIITVSEFSKSEIIKYMHIPEEKISVMPDGVDFNLFHSNYKEDEILKVKRKYNISGKYFLYLGTLEPRKNIERIIESYYNILLMRDSLPKLVIAGGKGWMYDTIFDLVDKLKIKEKVIFTGYILQQEVPILMQGAMGFLFPSLYEGFGMPVVEAMACGTPVITSNSSSLVEVAGDAAILVNPYNIEEIINGMLQLIDNKNLVLDLIERGYNNAKKFTWENSAKILMQVYKKILER